VIYARVEETLMLLSKMVEKSGLKEQLGGGVVLTGGFTQLTGLRELATAMFDSMPIRIGQPKKLDGLFDTLRTPAYSTAIGLILYGAGNFTPYEINSNKELKHSKKHEETKPISDGTPQKSLKMDEISNMESDSLNLVNKNIKNHDLTRISELDNNSNQSSMVSKIKQWVTQLF
jgi:cell division protein FtsA